MKNMKKSTLRALVMGLVVIIVAIGYFTTIGIGNLSGFGFDVFSVLCPLGYLESILASRVFVPRALISFVIIVILVILLGRVFCSWLCPMPFLQKWFGVKSKEEKELAKAQKAARKAGEPVPEKPVNLEPVNGGKPNNFKLDSRFGVLLGALASAAIFGFPVFCLICPVGLSFATVYLVMRLFAFGETTWTVIAVPAVLLIEVLFMRRWCSKFCPLGAIMSLISGANKTFRPTIDDSKCLNSSKGANCYQCAKHCPEGINIRKPEASETALNNCTKCHECSEHCPANAISFPLLSRKVGEKLDAQEK